MRPTHPGVPRTIQLLICLLGKVSVLGTPGSSFPRSNREKQQNGSNCTEGFFDVSQGYVFSGILLEWSIILIDFTTSVWPKYSERKNRFYRDHLSPGLNFAPLGPHVGRREEEAAEAFSTPSASQQPRTIYFPQTRRIITTVVSLGPEDTCNLPSGFLTILLFFPTSRHHLHSSPHICANNPRPWILLISVPQTSGDDPTQALERPLLGSPSLISYLYHYSTFRFCPRNSGPSAPGSPIPAAPGGNPITTPPAQHFPLWTEPSHSLPQGNGLRTTLPNVNNATWTLSLIPTPPPRGPPFPGSLNHCAFPTLPSRKLGAKVSIHTSNCLGQKLADFLKSCLVHTDLAT